jgi:isopenicillin-N epimerase
MERRTVEFHVHRQEEHLRQARQRVSDYVGALVENTAFVVNTTTAMNWVAHSLPLGAGDEVLLNDHEYGAVFRCWNVFARERGFRVVSAAVPAGGDVLASLQAAATARTRVVVVSHLTSPTAQWFPVEEIGAWARRQGIWSVVDGAHAPGHLPLQLESLGVDFYMGNLHKWLWAPKGSALLWVSPLCQRLIKPLVVSWGVDPVGPTAEPAWVNMVQLQATRDPSAFLAAPAGIDYQLRFHDPWRESHCWKRMETLSESLHELGAIPLGWSRPMKMRAFVWPFAQDPVAMHRFLFQRHRLEVPVYLWNGQLMVRVCLQHYVCDSELERLLQGLSETRVLAGSL